MSLRTKNKSRKWIVWVALATLLTTVLVPALLRPRQAAGREISARTGDIKTFYSFSGSIEAKNRQTVFAEQAAQVREFKVSEGDAVKADDVLYITNRGENVTARINGEVLRFYVQEGEQLMPGTRVMEIVDFSDLQLVVKVDEYDLSAIQEGVSANVTLHALGKEIEGRVSYVSKEGVHMNGVTFFTAAISIENDGDIRVGMSAEAKVLKESAIRVVTLPMSAIQFDDDNNPFVYVKEDRRTKTVDLTLGTTDGANVEVKSGLKVGDAVFVPSNAVPRLGPTGVRMPGSGGQN